jgi:methylglutaconyl-CoA hydratase
MVTPLLIYRIGTGPATATLLSGKALRAGEMMRMGLCHFVCAPNELETQRNELSTAILSGSPSALALTKRHIRNCAASTILAQLDSSVTLSGAARETPDAREGLAAFLEKRDPSWFRQP